MSVPVAVAGELGVLLAFHQFKAHPRLLRAKRLAIVDASDLSPTAVWLRVSVKVLANNLVVTGDPVCKETVVSLGVGRVTPVALLSVVGREFRGVFIMVIVVRVIATIIIAIITRTLISS